MAGVTTPTLHRPGTNPVWLVMASTLSVQFGAAIAKGAFATTSPIAMTWLRNTGAALIFITAALTMRRVVPRLRVLPTPVASRRRKWALGTGYAVTLVGMNWMIYESFARIPIGIAVTIEFLGPLAVAIWGTRRPRDVIWVVLAGTGVVLLGFSPTRLDPLGVVFAVAAAACWGAYIVLGAKIGGMWRSLHLLPYAFGLGAVTLAAPAILTAGSQLLTPVALSVGIGVALMSSVIPYSLELIALRHIPPTVFGILMSLEPAVAALAGLVVLREMLSPGDVVAMGCVIVASIGAMRQSRIPVG